MRYQIDDDTIVDTDYAAQSWDEASDWNGSNHISRATGLQWEHETLHRSRKGRYYIEHTSQLEGNPDYVTWASREEAARWLLLNDQELPEDLASVKEEVSE